MHNKKHDNKKSGLADKVKAIDPAFFATLSKVVKSADKKRGNKGK